MSLLPVALYGLEIPPGGILIPAMTEDSVPDAAYHITMAALDPTEAPEADEDGNIPNVPRATLKIVRQRNADMDDDLDEEELQQLMAGQLGDDDDEDEDDDEDDDEDEPNGGPSDPAKSKKAKQAAVIKKLLAAAQEDDDEEDDEDEEMGDDDDEKPNGINLSKKGKQVATEDDDDEDEDDDDEDDIEEFVVCTLDTERNYQQPLDITIGPNEKVYFVVKGTHAIHLTGNYLIDVDDEDDDEDDYDEDDEDDFPASLEELYGEDDEDEDDELDGIADPRVEEIDVEEDDDEEEAPKLVETKKGKNKRPANDEEDAEGLDELIAKAGGADGIKLSKKQQKKLKNNKGESVAVEEKDGAKGDKKVQFAKNLEQGPTGSTAAEKGGALGVKVVQGVTIDDRKIGSGRAVKKGSKVGVRYIGKLKDGKVFDSNKKGKPFSFTAGSGQVIKGWDIGVQGMSVGGERRLTIPAHLAYGSKSQPGIPSNSELIFDIKLLEIK